MKITDNTRDNGTRFGDLKMGDVFMEAYGDISMKIEGNDQYNSIYIRGCCYTGVTHMIGLTSRVTLLNADLIIS